MTRAALDGTELVLPEATHRLHLENPRGMAQALAAFFARHPLPATPPPS